MNPLRVVLRPPREFPWLFIPLRYLDLRPCPVTSLTDIFEMQVIEFDPNCTSKTELLHISKVLANEHAQMEVIFQLQSHMHALGFKPSTFESLLASKIE